jgi:hypothetical protein
VDLADPVDLVDLVALYFPAALSDLVVPVDLLSQKFLKNHYYLMYLMNRYFPKFQNYLKYHWYLKLRSHLKCLNYLQYPNFHQFP